MEKLLFMLPLLAAFAAFAGESEVEATAQVFGVLPVTTSSKSVIVSVPWTAVGSDAGDISVSNIIRTAELSVGDTVKVYSDSKGAFNVWTLAQNDQGVKYWSGVKVVTTNGVEQSDPADITTLARGGALILTRKDAPSASYTFYVCGQSSSSPASVTVTAGTSAQPAYTLVAPPGTAEVDLNDSTQVTWSGTIVNGASNDGIVYGENSGMGLNVYRKTTTTAGSNRWGYTGASGWVDAPKIQPGKGFWYVSRGGSPTITFN